MTEFCPKHLCETHSWSVCFSCICLVILYALHSGFFFSLSLGVNGWLRRAIVPFNVLLDPVIDDIVTFLHEVLDKMWWNRLQRFLIIAYLSTSHDRLRQKLC